MSAVGFEPGRSVHVRVYADFAAVDEQEDTIVPSARGLLPDLDDDATCGCLLALVRKAWGPGCRVDVVVFEDGSARVDVYPEDGEGWGREGNTLGLALAAALLAAPAPTEANHV